MGKKKAADPEEITYPYTFSLRFDEADKRIVDALIEMENETKRSRNQAIVFLLQEALREEGYLPPRQVRQPPPPI